MKDKLPEFDYYSFKFPLVGNPYKELSVFPMVNEPEEFDNDLDAFFADAEEGFANHFFSDVVIPMQTAWRMHKTDKNTQGAISILKTYCKAEDWQKACVEWLERRQKGKEETKDIEAVIGKKEEKDVGPCHK